MGHAQVIDDHGFGSVMDFTDVSLTALRVFRAVAEQGTFTAAAASLGYTQSAVSRQIAAIERVAGAELLERRRDGVRLTAAGLVVMRRATTVLDEIDATARELSGLPGQTGTVRLGWFPSAGAVLLPRALVALRRTDPGLHVVSREGSTPALGARPAGPAAWTSPSWRRRRPSGRRTPSRLHWLCTRSPNARCVWRCPPPIRSPAATSSTWPICAGSAGSPAPPPVRTG
jgi:Transcriptional regulator